ncbi:DUF4430 domain-containing protein [Crassaminicella indica]|uniref:DUF4430 domain-containing protein n=1 Tax=Crassaminicella indica TaxID=2855394 RepID=A0ABX8RAG3_9CLOT|nr:DUF4430 domain-containing protein [Crassaminicella indica]QXM05257.1 DUF4430 domain-containing protein [Crassaminicella indica]
MKKIFSFILVLTLVLSFAGVQAFATENITDITFEDGNDFTLGKQLYDMEEIKVVGLTANHKKVAINDTKNIQWRTSNPGVVRFFDDNWNEVNTINGKDTVNVLIVGKGKAKIEVTYKGLYVHSNVYVSGNGEASVENIKMNVNGEKTGKFEVKIQRLENFSLKNIYGRSYNDSGVMKDKVTALHAFLYALEYYHDSDGCIAVTDPNWDWDWVSRNVKVGYNGAFVQKVGLDENYGMTGWMYKVNGEMPMHAASQHELKNGDRELWFFGTWGKSK